MTRGLSSIDMAAFSRPAKPGDGGREAEDAMARSCRGTARRAKRVMGLFLRAVGGKALKVFWGLPGNCLGCLGGRRRVKPRLGTASDEGGPVRGRVARCVWG